MEQKEDKNLHPGALRRMKNLRMKVSAYFLLDSSFLDRKEGSNGESIE